MRSKRRGRTETDEQPVIPWALFPSDLGWMAAAWHGERLAALTFGHSTAAAAAKSLQSRTLGILADEPGDGRHGLVLRLQAYARGEAESFADVELDLDDRTDFQRKVLLACQRIPPGRTLSYGQLATRAGSAKAARAVGNVMAGNRIPLIVPCHRVVGGGGALGGFSAPDGLKMKKRLLRLEQTAAATVD